MSSTSYFSFLPFKSSFDPPFPDANALKQFITQLPRANYLLAKYLFGFFHFMCQFSAVTKMDVSNFSIVVGPNVFRRKDEDNKYGLAEFPQVLSVRTRSLYHHNK